MTAAILVQGYQEMGILFLRKAQHFGHIHFPWQAQYFRRGVLRVFANRTVRDASSGDNVQIAWQAWDIVT